MAVRIRDMEWPRMFEDRMTAELVLDGWREPLPAPIGADNLVSMLVSIHQ